MEHMRRRQAFVKHPQPTVETSFDVNKAKFPEELPRRRFTFAQATKVEQVEQVEQKNVVDEKENVEEKRPILTLPHKKRGRPPKTNQSA